MGMFFLYSIKSGLCLIAFYLFYKLVMSRYTFHSFNRMAILLMMLSAMVVPLVQVELERTPAVATVTVDWAGVLAIAEQPLAASSSESLSLVQLLFLLYIIGVVVFAVGFLVSLVRLRLMLRNGRRMDDGQNEHLIVVDDDIAPFSWFNYIVLSRKDYEGHPAEILAHERAHMHRHHSADILVCNLILIVQWFNPAAWLLRRELQEVHEFEADEMVLASGINARQYQLLLVEKAVGEARFALANNFNHSSLKKRITMMKMQKSNAWNRAKLLLALPLAAVAVVAFASEKTKQVADRIVAESDNAVVAVTGEQALPQQQKTTTEKKKAAQKQTDGKVYDVVQTMPQFPGGHQAMLMYLASNIKYPDDAVAAEKGGRVIVSFVVDKEGNVTKPTILRSVSESLDKEALRVVGAMPKWTPGMENGEPVAVKYTVPVNFNIYSGPSNASGEKAEPKKLSLDASFVIVNGKRVDDVNSVPTDQISSIQVYKDAENIKKYGGDEKTTSVIVIQTKDAK